jgi:nucleoside transporter
MSELTTSQRSSRGTMTSLSIMMFLEFFIWGAWYVTLSTFMTEAHMTSEIGLAYMLCPIAALISPFFLGIVADRFFSSERVLAVLMLLGGVAMFFVPTAARHGVWPFLGVILIHSLCYMPTLGLTNTIAFAHITDQEKQYPLIRVYGTVGWIIAGLMISLVMHADKTAGQFMLAGGASILLGLFSLVLPHTPPPARGKRFKIGEILGTDALALFRSPSFVVFAIASFLICIPLAAYYSFAGRMVTDFGRSPAGWMSIGQDLEVVFILLMPLFFRWMGVKWMLALGMLAWVARYALFAVGAPAGIFWLVLIGIALHGVCYDFFFVTGFIYTDQKATKEIRGQAQGLLVLITQGFGLGLGAYLTGDLFNRTVGAATGAAALTLYPKFWWICGGFAFIVLAGFALLFRDDSKEPVAGPQSPVEPAETAAA